MSPSFHSHHLKTLQQMLDSGPDAILLVSKTGKIIFANAAVEAIFGYSRNEVLGQSVEMLIPEEFRERHKGLHQEYAANPKPRSMGAGLSLNGRRKDGSLVPVDIALSHFQMNEEAITSCWIRDDSVRRFQQEKRDHLLTQLQETLKKFQGLERLVPICAQCKKIRNSQEDWVPVEEFIHKYAKTEFTHGFCPECLQAFLKPWT